MFDSWKTDSQGAAGFSRNRYLLAGLGLLALLVLGAAALIAPTTAGAQGQSGTTLSASKTASATYDRTYDWTIDKSADQTSLTLQTGQTFNVNYTVTVNATNGTNSASVSGEVCVTNGGDVATEDLAIHDVLTNGVPPPDDVIAQQDVDVSSNPVLDPGESDCYPYEFNLTAAQTHAGGTYKNTANVTITNHSGHLDTPFGPSPSATTVMPSTPTEECVDVEDTLQGDLGTVCGNATFPKTFTYTRQVGPYEECGEYDVDNTASFENDRVSGSDSWHIDVTVPCGGGCTLTQGYWKTHSDRGPAPYDDTWAQLPNGEDTQFLNLNNPVKTWYQIFWTAPQNGNAFLILAHQYQAAYLNSLSGASVPSAVQTALNQAADLLDNYTSIPNVNGAVKNTMLQLAGVLKAYNEGTTGPGHCSEDSTSSKTA
jgi:hypothetical protein